MEKQCGYVDANGFFHDTEEKCELSNLMISIKDTENKICKLEIKIRDSMYYAVRYYQYPDQIIDRSAEWIVKNSDCLLELLSNKKELDLELSELQQSALKIEQKELKTPEATWFSKVLNNLKPNKQ
jgi:hypothetical protein